MPKDVQASFLLWLAALAAGVDETSVGIVNFDLPASETILMVASRIAITTGLVYIIVQMRLGKIWPASPWRYCLVESALSTWRSARSRGS